ncbi:hypothetical protein [Solirubrum puertoriconensis]|uniref:Uncharacterized protein n=1 Tax=Solirubrum puertoriconensis TaxID=1751427 RepID=A0A9X0HK62_SOLP1|nr:hypothetical protein [Solirubrum puertoriconensis]KUG07407.1 hypothetical protein ASU33_13725 [Solirubrum puertoriconensis]
MFINIQLSEEESVLVNTAAVKAISPIAPVDSRRLYGIELEFINRKEKSYVIQFKTSAERDRALQAIIEAVNPDVSFAADNVELREKGWND